MRILAATFAVILAGATQPALAQQGSPSFDCTGTLQPVEALICADPALADLDHDLAESYHAALSTQVDDAQSALRMEQRTWAGNRANACGIDADPAIDVDDAIACLAALYRGRIAELQLGDGSPGNLVTQSGYGWLMGEWAIAGIRTSPANEAANAQLGRLVHLAESPIVTPYGAACSFPRYSAEPSPRSEFGDLSEYPAAVMVRVTCVGIALLDVVRLTDEKILLGEGKVVFELERRR